MLTLQFRIIRCFSAKCNKKSKTIINNAYNLYNNNQAPSALSVIIVSGLFFCGYKKNPPALPADSCPGERKRR
jgi:hypothetical protein